MSQYIAFQRSIIERRTKYDLKKAEARVHLLEGLRIACDNIDEVIRIIRTSYNDAKQRLMERFGLSEIQTQAILEMQLRRLQGLEREKIEEEYNLLMGKISEYNEILASEQRQLQIVKEELTEIKSKYGDDRRTEISSVENDIDMEDLIPEEEAAYTLTRFGYIKRVPASEYKAQRRGGKGVNGMTTRDEDAVLNLFTASTHDYVLFFSNLGKVYRLKGYMIPEAGKIAKGMNIVNLLQLESGENITLMLPVHEFSEDKFVVMVTKLGVVKRMQLNDLLTVRKAGIRIITIAEGDELISVRITDGSANIILATKDGKGLRFHEAEVRTMGRTAAGVRGIRLSEGDFVIGAARQRENAYLLTVTENGYGKLTDIEEFAERHRGGQGITAHNLTEKTGALAAIKVVTKDDDVLLMTSDGTVIRTSAENIRLCGRASQGVILMRIEDGVKIISVEKTDKEETAEDSSQTPEIDEANTEA